jgi:hypothetical protein
MPITSNPEAVYTGNRTIGGLPSDQAEHWCEKNYQILGNLVYQMTLGNLTGRIKAQSEVCEMRRHFMRDEWDQYINALEELRRKSGFVPFSSYFDRITEDAIIGRDQTYIEREPREIITQCKQATSNPVKKIKTETVIQLSLF